MKPITFLPFLSFLLLLTPSSGNAAGSMLRITCDGDDVGSEVLVNGKFRGECPIDLQVPEGSLKLLVRKKVDGGRERVFEQEIRMGEGSVKKVEVHLGAAKLSADEAALQAENTRRFKGMSLVALQKEAEAGDINAMMSLAWGYQLGTERVPQNKDLALMWMLKAAKAGNVDAMYRCWAFMYSPGVRQDLEQGGMWLRKAAEGGNTSAMSTLARHPHSKNDAEALTWYRRAAELGDKSAMFWVGSYYELGMGVTKNIEEAVAWYRKAAEGENPDENAVEELKKRGLR